MGELNKKKYGVLACMVLALGISGCSAEKKKEDESAKAKKEIEQVISDQVKAINRKDVDDYMQAYSKDMFTYDAIKKEYETLVDEYNIKLTVDRVQVLSINDKYATIEAKTTAKNKDKSVAYTDNVVKMRYVLEKEKDKWIITSQGLLTAETLDGESLIQERNGKES
ncbi:YybH family protein [Bacillus sp. C1]